ncbi:hypothetical protein CGZ80_25925 [Rhodopirellula sp. MGV]|nr:hypothetical protein CGZ80_25925 [Rhodopirellula sp. MGV]PNY38858.1 hypothetical protein C2E31_02880 [Rhodopirellula baltica]
MPWFSAYRLELTTHRKLIYNCDWRKCHSVLVPNREPETGNEKAFISDVCLSCDSGIVLRR